MKQKTFFGVQIFFSSFWKVFQMAQSIQKRKEVLCHKCGVRTSDNSKKAIQDFCLETHHWQCRWWNVHNPIQIGMDLVAMFLSVGHVCTGEVGPAVRCTNHHKAYIPSWLSFFSKSCKAHWFRFTGGLKSDHHSRVRSWYLFARISVWWYWSCQTIKGHCLLVSPWTHESIHCQESAGMQVSNFGSSCTGHHPYIQSITGPLMKSRWAAA